MYHALKLKKSTITTNFNKSFPTQKKIFTGIAGKREVLAHYIYKELI